MDHVTFDGGWWADLRTEWPYGADTRIAAAFLFMGEDPVAFDNAHKVLLVESVVNAHLPDLAGDAVEFGPEMWDRVSGRIGRTILKRCRVHWAAWQKDADPNATAQS